MAKPQTNPEQDQDLLTPDSSFYGSDTEKARLEELADSYDPGIYWTETHPRVLSVLQWRARRAAHEEDGVKDEDGDDVLADATDVAVKVELEVPMGADVMGGESVSLSRAAGPWVYVLSPGVASEEGDVARLVRSGTKVLRRFTEQKVELEREHDASGAKTKIGLARKLTPLRLGAEREILGRAREAGVVRGKWMVFLGEDEVDEAWGSVVRETLDGRLGVAAKVGTQGKERLLAVYTRDFGDVDDVRRVVGRLVEMGLVDRKGKPVYYKCDAYTYLEILGGNSYGIKASMFSSRDVLERKV
ncbi:DUF1917-domain-containing protein [Aspergillus avenaceus]|uniref:DUF1917-domain-containing protein n=1 Tax=Aspergillus avenaceus TaxID=36643 RepID=A0A5N6U5T4_ASPAV|nr:DUF1917-domain-containing protein [Aspergillus avenaceus]